VPDGGAVKMTTPPMENVALDVTEAVPVPVMETVGVKICCSMKFTVAAELPPFVRAIDPCVVVCEIAVTDPPSVDFPNEFARKQTTIDRHRAPPRFR
jgi:hypothetical protein